MAPTDYDKQFLCHPKWPFLPCFQRSSDTGRGTDVSHEIELEGTGERERSPFNAYLKPTKPLHNCRDSCERPNIADSSLGIWKGCANSSPTSNWTMSCHTFDNNNTLRMKSDVDVSKVCCYNLPSDASSSLSPAKMCGGFLCPTIRIPTLRTSLRL
jgi:hypothetical protein